MAEPMSRIASTPWTCDQPTAVGKTEGPKRLPTMWNGVFFENVDFQFDVTSLEGSKEVLKKIEHENQVYLVPRLDTEYKMYMDVLVDGSVTIRNVVSAGSFQCEDNREDIWGFNAKDLSKFMTLDDVAQMVQQMKSILALAKQCGLNIEWVGQNLPELHQTLLNEYQGFEDTMANIKDGINKNEQKAVIQCIKTAGQREFNHFMNKFEKELRNQMPMTSVVGNNECPPSGPMPSAPPPEEVLTQLELEEVFPDVFLRPSERPTTEEDKEKSQIDISEDVHKSTQEIIIEGFKKKHEEKRQSGE